MSLDKILENLKAGAEKRAPKGVYFVLTSKSVHTPSGKWQVVSYNLTGKETFMTMKRMFGLTYDVYVNEAGLFIATNGRKVRVRRR